MLNIFCIPTAPNDQYIQKKKVFYYRYFLIEKKSTKKLKKKYKKFVYLIGIHGSHPKYFPVFLPSMFLKKNNDNDTMLRYSPVELA